MKNRSTRLSTIREIISRKEIGSQEQLLDELSKEGYTLTQATLSRDLKQLKVAKTATANGGYSYIIPEQKNYRRVMYSSPPINNRWGFTSIQFSGNIAVVKTKPGYASSLASDIDSRNIPEIIGTIAGDDTIMLIMAEGASQEDVSDALHPLMHMQ